MGTAAVGYLPGFNVWRSLQYLVLVSFLIIMRRERGQIANHFIASPRLFSTTTAITGERLLGRKEVSA